MMAAGAQQDKFSLGRCRRRSRPEGRPNAVPATRTLRRPTWALILALGGSAGACQRPKTDTWGSPQPRHAADELWLAGAGEPETLDPGLCSDEVGGDLIYNLFAGLLDAHPETLEPVPDLARSWQTSADGRTYTFDLRPSTWSDGVPLTAHDFVYSWRRVLDPTTASRYASLLFLLRGGEAFHRGALWLSASPPLPGPSLEAWAQAELHPSRTQPATDPDGRAGVYVYPPDDAQDPRPWRQRALGRAGSPLADSRLSLDRVGAEHVAVRAQGEHTLEVILDQPLPYFLQLLTFHTFRPVPRHLLQRLAATGVPEALWTEPQHIVVSGAFTLVDWQFKRAMLLHKNPRFWAADQVALARVKVLNVDNVTTAMNLYQTGDLDWTSKARLPSEYLPALRPYRDVHLAPVMAVTYLWLNAHRPPLDRLPLRQALSLAIDRTALTTQVLRGGQVPTADLVPPGLNGYPDRHSPLFDPNQARQRLREAGFARGADLPPLVLSYNAAEVNRQLAETIQGMWRQHLGLHVSLENQEWKVYLQNMAAQDFDIARMGWVGDYPDAHSFLHDVLGAQAGNNHGGWRDPTFDALLLAANAEAEPAARQALLRRAEDVAMQAQPLIPLYVGVHAELRKPYLLGVHANAQDRHPWRHLRMDPGYWPQAKRGAR